MIKFKNLDGVIDAIDDLGDTTDIQSAMKKGCAIVERSAKTKAPKGTGELRRSIISEVVNEGSQIVGNIFTPLEYAPYVEFGTGLFAEKGGRKDVPWSYKDDKGEWHTTSGMHPQPFLRPAFYESREEVIKALRGGMKR